MEYTNGYVLPRGAEAGQDAGVSPASREAPGNATEEENLEQENDLDMPQAMPELAQTTQAPEMPKVHMLYPVLWVSRDLNRVATDKR